jgi:hypothetical protein
MNNQSISVLLGLLIASLISQIIKKNNIQIVYL